MSVQAVSRRPRRESDAASPYVSWCTLEDVRSGSVWCAGTETVIHLAPLGLLPTLIPILADHGVKRLIAFGSTSRFTKMNSPDIRERQFAVQLQDAERAMASHCDTFGIRWTLFRPTLVYALGRDRNVTTIARFISRFGFFPLIGKGAGMRQPVHAEDLAAACLSVMDNPATFGKSYNLSGGEALSYRNMVIRLFGQMRRPVCLVSIPLSVLRMGLMLGALWPRYRYFSPEMANRMNQDMCFEVIEAQQDFGFNPRAFLV
ncbi:MAG: SDR family oxidoreductase [Methylococcaceae bacterium]